MDIGITIRFLRIENRLTLKDLSKDILSSSRLSSSRLSLVENNKADITLYELEKIAERFNMSLIELINFSKTSHNDLNTLVLESLINPNKHNMLKIYNILSTEKSKNLFNLHLYIFFKTNTFKYEFIPKLNISDISIAKSNISDPGIKTILHYKIFVNLIPFLESSDIDYLYTYLFPVKHSVYRNSEFKQIEMLAYNNLITRSIKQNDFKKTEYLLDQAKANKQILVNYISALQINYLENLYLYAKTKNLQNKELATYYAMISHNLGDQRTYESMIHELTLIDTLNKQEIDEEFSVFFNEQSIMKSKYPLIDHENPPIHNY